MDNARRYIYNLLDIQTRTAFVGRLSVSVTEIRNRLTWGQVLRGMVGRKSMKTLAEVAGGIIGAGLNRTSLAETFDLDEAPTEGLPGLRAWVILTAIGEDPAAWGVPNSVLPAGLNPKRTRDLLVRHLNQIQNYDALLAA